MAKIIENNAGRRLVRLSVEDVLSVVAVYQQKMMDNSRPKTYQALQQLLTQHPVYLPEELA